MEIPSKVYWLAPNIIVAVEVKEEDAFYKFMDTYDQWDNTPYTPIVEDDMGSSDTSTSPSNNELGNESIKSDFCISE